MAEKKPSVKVSIGKFDILGTYTYAKAILGRMAMASRHPPNARRSPRSRAANFGSIVAGVTPRYARWFAAPSGRAGHTSTRR